jgi:hypothetical protein
MVHTDQTRIAQNGKQSNRTNTIAEIEVLILRQQQLAAKLARNDHNYGEARAARNKLFGLLNQLDRMQEGQSQAQRVARGPEFRLSPAEGMR